jgi:hypothetical protein
MVYTAPDHRIVDKNDKIDFYVLGPNLICVLKNSYSMYVNGRAFLSDFGRIDIYRNNIEDWYDNAKSAFSVNDSSDLAQDEAFRAFSRVRSYSKDDLIHDILIHEYAHGLDSFLYNDANPYLFYETEARAFLLEIAESVNPYFMIVHTKSNFLAENDPYHLIGSLLAISLLRSFAPSKNFDTEYLSYSPSEIREIAKNAFMFTHHLYGVPIDRNNGKPFLPVICTDEGERIPVDSYELKESGMLFNMIILPYIDQNRHHAKYLCSLIEKKDKGLWDRKLIDYFTGNN